MLPATDPAPHRTQRQRSDATRAALVAAARGLFGERGFHATPAEDIVTRAGVTSGALYHHFRDKRDLFRSALDAAERALAERVARAASSGRDPWERLERGVDEYLRACGEREVRRIILLDGPSVLGWEEWRELDANHHLRPLGAVLALAMRAGLVEKQPVEPVARLLLGALTEAGLASDADRQATRTATAWLLSKLRIVSGGGSLERQLPR
jgi:AcrR family transcriptional regulator